MQTYLTISGDTWDLIAKKVYGDDHAFEILMDANQKHIDTMIFRAGVILQIPSLPDKAKTVDSDQARWREVMNGR